MLRSNNTSGDCPAHKKPKQEKNQINICVPKKCKENKKTGTKIKRVTRRGNLFNEWTENESSNVEITGKSENSINKNMSNESVIYVGATPIKRIPIVDLTRSAESIAKGENTILKTIYFPSRNFDRSMKFRKTLATRSLVTLPTTVKLAFPKKTKSATFLNKNKDKLGILDIPSKYFDGSETSFTDFEVSHADLTENDHKIINWILEQENVNLEGIFSTSGDCSSLDTGLDSIGEMCRAYGVCSEDSFD